MLKTEDLQLVQTPNGVRIMHKDGAPLLIAPTGSNNIELREHDWRSDKPQKSKVTSDAAWRLGQRTSRRLEGKSESDCYEWMPREHGGVGWTKKQKVLIRKGELRMLHITGYTASLGGFPEYQPAHVFLWDPSKSPNNPKVYEGGKLTFKRLASNRGMIETFFGTSISDGQLKHCLKRTVILDAHGGDLDG